MIVTSVFKRYKVKSAKGKVYDPIRKKYVQATPEEYVRQKTISFLVDYMKVPSERIIVERSLSTLGIKDNKRRIDIGILGPEDDLIAIIEKMI